MNSVGSAALSWDNGRKKFTRWPWLAKGDVLSGVTSEKRHRAANGVACHGLNKKAPGLRPFIFVGARRVPRSGVA